MASYTTINGKTMAAITAASTVAGAEKEQRWVLKAHVESLGSNPFTGFIGGWKSGKPIIEVADTRKLAGQKINLHRLAPLAGPGKQGEASRDGGEEQYRFSNYTFEIGRLWNGTGQNTVARDQTVIGSNFDTNARKLLGDWMGWQKGMNIEYSLIAGMHARNTLYPGYKSSREQLRTTDVLDGFTVNRAGNTLGSLQAKPLKLTKSESGHVVPGFLVISTQYGLAPFKASSTYTSIMSQAGQRGDANELFKGGLPKWNGHSLWEWMVEDHCGFGPVGAACAPRAFTGAAITAGSATFDIVGGGSTEGGALTTPLYFQHFSNAAFVGFEGTKIPASTATTRYVAIMNMSGADVGKINFYSYTTNNGNKLVVAGRLDPLAVGTAGIRAATLGNITVDASPWIAAGNGANFAGMTDAHPVGSLVYEVNSYGVPIGKSYVLADEAVMSGYGSIDGKTGFGNRTEFKGPHGLDYAVGLEAVWGCKAIPRVDGIPNGFIVIEHAVRIDGHPDVI